VFGMIRYMSLEGMKRKTDVDWYVGEMNRLPARQGSYTMG
jgi:hypothetical protein